MTQEEAARVNGDGAGSEAYNAFIEFIVRTAREHGIDPEVGRAVITHLIHDAGDKGLSDEDLEKLTGFRQGVIRRTLRILYEMRLVYYRRGRHPETRATRYYWLINTDAVNIMLYRFKKDVLSKLRRRLEYERDNTFFKCPYHPERYTFNEAFSLDFTCPKCGHPLEEVDNSAIIEFLERLTKSLEEEIRRDERKLFNH